MNAPHNGIESSTFASSFVGHEGGERGGSRGGCGRVRPRCTYFMRFGHTEDKCYSLMGFPRKLINVTQSNDSGKDF